MIPVRVRQDESLRNDPLPVGRIADDLDRVHWRIDN